MVAQYGDPVQSFAPESIHFAIHNPWKPVPQGGLRGILSIHKPIHVSIHRTGFVVGLDEEKGAGAPLVVVLRRFYAVWWAVLSVSPVVIDGDV